MRFALVALLFVIQLVYAQDDKKPLGGYSAWKLVDVNSDIGKELVGYKDIIEKAIEHCDGNIPRAAALLDVSPSTIYRKKQSWQ